MAVSGSFHGLYSLLRFTVPPCRYEDDTCTLFNVNTQIEDSLVCIVGRLSPVAEIVRGTIR